MALNSMSNQLQPDDKHDQKAPDFNSIYAGWGEVFVKTYQAYCKSEPDGQRRQSVTLVALAILGLLAMAWIKVPDGIMYAFLALISLVLVLSWKRT